MHKLQSVLAADPVRFSDLMVNGGGAGGASNELKIHVLKDLKAQQTMAGMSPVSSSGGGLPVSGSSSSSVVVTGTPMWSNNLFDLPGMKADNSGSGSTSCDLAVSSLGDSGNLSGSTNTSGGSLGGGLNSSTTSSSISNSNNNNNNNEDSYEAGIADDMRELALRLESELNIN